MDSKPNFKALIEFSHITQALFLVNDVSEDEDEGYSSFTATAEVIVGPRRRRKLIEEDLNFDEENTKDELQEKLFILREAFEDLQGQYNK